MQSRQSRHTTSCHDDTLCQNRTSHSGAHQDTCPRPRAGTSIPYVSIEHRSSRALDARRYPRAVAARGAELVAAQALSVSGIV
eukprot:1465694-Rhodomonas_salina.2